MKFIYVDNSTYPSPPTILFEVESENILLADKLFEEKTGINPVKKMTIGVQIEKHS